MIILIVFYDDVSHCRFRCCNNIDTLMKKYNPKGRLRSCKGIVHKYIPSDRPTKESKQCNNKRRIHVKYVIIIITIWTSSNQEANNSESLSIKRRKKNSKCNRNTTRTIFKRQLRAQSHESNFYRWWSVFIRKCSSHHQWSRRDGKTSRIILMTNLLNSCNVFNCKQSTESSVMKGGRVLK